MSLSGYDAKMIDTSILDGSFIALYSNAVWASSNEDDKKIDTNNVRCVKCTYDIKCLKCTRTADPNVLVCEICQVTYKDGEILDAVEILKDCREECGRLYSKIKLTFSQLSRERYLIEKYPHEEEFDTDYFEQKLYKLQFEFECAYEQLEMAELAVLLIR